MPPKNYLSEEIAKVYDFLDTVDITKYINKARDKYCCTVSELMEDIEANIKYQDEYSRTLFDNVNELEFVNYLISRYSTRIVKETKYYIG